MIAEFDRLAEKVERAMSAIVKLRDDNSRLREQCERLQAEVARLEGADGDSEAVVRLTSENAEIVKERDQLLNERAVITERVRGLIGKVEKLEELS